MNQEKNTTPQQQKAKRNTPDTTTKKEGVTSSFSAATGTPGKYSGEDTAKPSGSTGTDEDKTVDSVND